MSPRRARPVRWRRAAVADVMEITGYIARTSPLSASRLADRLFARTDILATFPYIGTAYERVRGLRFLVEGRFVIYYTVHRHEVLVRAVVRGARRFDRSWLRRDD